MFLVACDDGRVVILVIGHGLPELDMELNKGKAKKGRSDVRIEKSEGGLLTDLVAL